MHGPVSMLLYSCRIVVTFVVCLVVFWIAGIAEFARTMGGQR